MEEKKRNVIDFFSYWKTSDILLHLDTKRHPFGVLCCNIGGDFNISTAIRNNNAFLAKEVFIYGNRRWDRRGAVGTYHYSHIKHIQTEEELDSISDYTWVGIDNIPGAVPMDEYSWPENPLMCFGEEQHGLAPEIIKRCKDIVYIRQYGSVRSLNVGTASGIAMYDFTNKLYKKGS